MHHMSHSTRINDASHVASHVYRMAHHMCTSDVSHGALRVHHLSYRMCCVTPAQPNTAASRSPWPSLCIMQRHIVVCHASTNERCCFALPWSLAACHATTHRHTHTNECCCFALPWPLAVCHATTLRCVSRQHRRTPLFRAPLAPRCVSCSDTSVCVTPARTNFSDSRSPRPSLCVTHRRTPTMFPRAPLASLRAVCHT